jgi:uncharacterized membrane protein YgcG
VPQQALAASNFLITDYDIQVVVNEDDTYEVTETINVHFTLPSHGIYRTIPLRTTLDRDGQKTKYFAKVKDFTMLSGEAWEDESETAEFNARIGNPSYFADTDTVYKMRYIYDTGGDHFKNGDELYYNLVGTSWEAKSIDHVSFNIVFPKDIDMSKVGIKTGSNEYVPFEAVSDREIKGETARYVKNGLTVRAVLPEGYFTRQAKTSNILLYIISALMVVLAAVGFVLWRKYGIDPHIVETEEFYPPEKLSAPEVGYLAEGSVTGTHVISALLSLADRGYLKIAEVEIPVGKKKKKTKETYEITKLREYDDSVIGESVFLKGLFKEGDSVTLDQLKDKFYTTVNAVKKLVENHYKGKLYDPKAAKYARVMKTGAIVGMILLMALCLLNGSMPLSLGGEDAVMGILYAGTITITLFIIGFGGIGKRIQEGRKGLGILGFIGCILLGVILSFVFGIAPGTKFVPYIIGIGASFVLFIISALCERKTDWYASVLGKIRGYKNFLEIAEKDRMEALAEEDPEYFYKNLAFAYSLGVTTVYAKNFASLATEPPEWYEGTVYVGGDPVTSMSFLNSMDSMMKSISSSMTSSPSSSGGGGGSFSGGGGGGGGGGGSW